MSLAFWKLSGSLKTSNVTVRFAAAEMFMSRLMFSEERHADVKRALRSPHAASQRNRFRKQRYHQRALSISEKCTGVALPMGAWDARGRRWSRLVL